MGCRAGGAMNEDPERELTACFLATPEASREGTQTVALVTASSVTDDASVAEAEARWSELIDLPRAFGDFGK
jgi:hypothetical protein